MEKCWGRCEKVCWGVGEVRGNVGGSVGDVKKCWKTCGKGKCGERCGWCGEVMGKVWESVLGCGGGRGGMGKCWERCEKVCWGGGEVRGDVGGSVGVVEKCWERCGKGKCGERCVGCLELLGKVWESVLGCGESKGRYVGKCWGGVGKCVEVWGR